MATIDFTLDDFRKLIHEETQPMIDRVVDRLDQRFDRLETKMERRFDLVEYRLDRLESRVDEVDERLTIHARTTEQMHAGLEARVTHLEQDHS